MRTTVSPFFKGWINSHLCLLDTKAISSSGLNFLKRFFPQSSCTHVWMWVAEPLVPPKLLHRPLLWELVAEALEAWVNKQWECGLVTTYVSLACVCVCARDAFYTAVSCTYICIVLSVYVSDNFTDSAVSGRINGEHKEKDLEPWDGGETHNSDSLESLDTDVVRTGTQQTLLMFSLTLLTTLKSVKRKKWQRQTHIFHDSLFRYLHFACHLTWSNPHREKQLNQAFTATGCTT